ncbi:MAG: hypothetical protein RLZZ359_300 [Actinomycetota bacterium]
MMRPVSRLVLRSVSRATAALALTAALTLAPLSGAQAAEPELPPGYPTVAIVPGSTINLVAHESKIPLSIRNDFDSEVTVHAWVIPESFAVIVPHGIEVKIPPKTTVTAQVPVIAVSNGEVDLKAYLTTFSGRRFNGSVKLHMVVNADIETSVIFAFGASVVTLLGFGVVRTIRRRRNPAEINNLDKYETEAIDIVSPADLATAGAAPESANPPVAQQNKGEQRS